MSVYIKYAHMEPVTNPILAQGHQQRAPGHVPAEVPGRAAGGGRGGHGAGAAGRTHLRAVPVGGRLAQADPGQERSVAALEALQSLPREGNRLL